MSKIHNLKSFDEFENHIFDEYTNLGYNYHQNMLNRVLSMEMFANPLNDKPMRLLERLLEFLVDEVKKIKLTYAYALPKDTTYIN